MNNHDHSDENDAYNLLPPSLETILPPLYATEKIAEDEKIVYAKFFVINTRWTWFVLEGEWDADHENFTFFGLVHGLEKEYGYFTLNELESLADDNLLYSVERDLYFDPTPLNECVDDD
jgi:hypothetical protein